MRTSQETESVIIRDPTPAELRTIGGQAANESPYVGGCVLEIDPGPKVQFLTPRQERRICDALNVRRAKRAAASGEWL